jgi:hypothetical protein
MPVKLKMPEHRPFKIDPDSLLRAEAISRAAANVIDQAIELRPVQMLRREAQYAVQHGASQPVEQAYADSTLGDVVASLDRASVDFTFYSRIGAAPVLTSNETPMAVSLKTVLSDVGKTEMNVEVYQHLAQDLRSMESVLLDWTQRNDSRAVVKVEDARNGFLAHLAGFLGNRLSGLKQWKDNDNGGDPGLFHVEVRCRTPGYSVQISPAYFIDWVFFGSPSTPVAKNIPPGRYIFGTYVNNTLIEDKTIFQIPNDFNPDLKRF